MANPVEKARTIRQNTWAKEPEDITRMLDTSKGYTDTWDSSFFPTLFAWEETIASRNVLFVIRKTLLEGGIDLRTVKRLTHELLKMYIPFLRWANLPETEGLFQEISDHVMSIDSSKELVTLLEDLILYVGRLNYWIEPLMPWNELIKTFDSATS
jgi:hypothetical protein